MGLVQQGLAQQGLWSSVGSVVQSRVGSGSGPVGALRSRFQQGLWCSVGRMGTSRVRGPVQSLGSRVCSGSAPVGSAAQRSPWPSVGLMAHQGLGSSAGSESGPAGPAPVGSRFQQGLRSSVGLSRVLQGPWPSVGSGVSRPSLEYGLGLV